MTFEFRPAVRENVPLLIGLAGGTGAGKTMSAMRIAKGLADGQRFAVIDTENGRALHYADMFEFDHAPLHAPFRPERYAEAIEAADKAGYPVILVDSASHEHAGEGGLLDWHESEFQRMGGKDAVKMTAWIKPKMAHKQMVTRLLQVSAHVILCFRAEEKLEQITGDDGKKKWVPKKSLTGLGGWVPVSEKTLPYELTISFLVTADAPGIPKPIKLQEQHRAFVPLDEPLSEETGRRLGEWARGGTLSQPEGDLGEAGRSRAGAPDDGSDSSGSESVWADEHDVPKLLDLANRVSVEEHDLAASKIVKHRQKNDGKVLAQWLADYTAAIVAKLPVEEPADEPAEQSAFEIPQGARS